MSKVLSIYERNIPTVAIMRNAVEKNQDVSVTEKRFKQVTEVTQADIDWCDVLEMIRPSDPYSVFLAKYPRTISLSEKGMATPPRSRVRS